MTARQSHNENVPIRHLSTMKKASPFRKQKPSVRFSVAAFQRKVGFQQEQEQEQCNTSLENERKAMLYKQGNCILTASGEQRQKVAKYVNVVLEEQLSQWENSMYDPERLAMVSMCKSLDSQVDALLRGRQDELLAHIK